MSDFYLEFLAACVKCIDINDKELFYDLLNTKTFDRKQVDSQMIEFLQYCKELHFRDEFIKIICNTWKFNIDPTMVFLDNIISRPSLQVSFEVYIASKLYNDYELLSYVLNIISPKVTFKDLIFPDIINNVQDSTTELICLALDKCFNTSFDDYKELLDLSIGKNPNVTNYLEKRLIQIADYAGVPNYIDLENLRKFEILQYNENKKLTFDQCIEYLYEKSKQFFDYDENKKDQIVNSIKKNIINNENFIETTSKIYNQEIDNMENLDLYFKLYGFSNPIQNEPLDGSDLCTRFGGCRMLLCTCQESIDPDTGVEIETDWFTGFCLECSKKIRSRSHALRLPMVGGGWKYTFCGFKCIKTYIQNMPNCDSYETLLIYNVVRQMQNELLYKKIYDSYDPDDDLEDDDLMDRSCIITDDDIGDYVCNIK